MHSTSFPSPYEARRPTESILHQTLAEHLSSFTYEREQELCRLPKYVREELEAFLRCGLHQYGFLRIRCPDDSCGFEHALPFSCKKMGFCSSCFAKRAAEVEEHLTDKLLPRAPYRQYVLTFPHSLRYRLAWDSQLLAAIHKTVIDLIYRFIRDQLAGKFKRKDLRPGSVSFIQRCGSLLNLNLHFHLLVLDGAFICREKKRPFFHKIKGPSSEAIGELLGSIIEAVELCLGKRGLLEDDASIEIEDEVSVGAAPCTGKSNKVKVGGGSWARLLRRVFAVDVSKCPRCGADLEIISAVLDPEQISRYLKYVGMPTAPPPRAGIKMKVLCDEWY